MLVFVNAQKLLSLDTLKDKFVYQDYFCFNNAALCIPSKIAGPNTKAFWKLCIWVQKIFRYINYSEKIKKPKEFKSQKKVKIYLIIIENCK